MDPHLKWQETETFHLGEDVTNTDLRKSVGAKLNFFITANYGQLQTTKSKSHKPLPVRETFERRNTQLTNGFESKRTSFIM